MFWSSLLLLPALLSPACLAAPSQEKRAAVNDAVLYAYGTNISGYPVLYQSTGDLYIASSNSTSLEPITFDIASMTNANEATLSGTLTDGTAAGDVWIDTTDNIFERVTLVSSARNSTVNGTMGFTHYGMQLVWIGNSTIESNFWAQEISTAEGTTVWALHWNTDNVAYTGAVPVVLKTAAPSA